MPRVHGPTGLVRPDSSTTHTEVSFWETSNPTYCFMTASESFGCNKSKVTGLLSPLTVDRNYVIVPKFAPRIASSANVTLVAQSVLTIPRGPIR